MSPLSSCAGDDLISAFLQHGIEEALRVRRVPDVGSAPRIVRAILHEDPGALPPFPSPPAGCADELRWVLSHEHALTPIVEAAVERWRGGAHAPVLSVVCRPLSAERTASLLGRGTNFGLLFAAEKVYFQDTVHALQTDESRSRKEGDRTVNVLGVRLDWRTPDGRKAGRCLLADPAGVVREVAFEVPVPLDLVWTLHLPREGEIALHQQISAQCRALGLPEVNPYSASARADDKALTHTLWSRALPRVPSPEAVLVPRGACVRDALSTLGACESVFVQPNRGTEGDRAARFVFRDLDGIRRHICRGIWPQDDALVREERGGLRCRNADPAAPGIDGPLRFVVRLNVVWDGTKFVAESGFVQLARDAEHPVAARGRGGSLMSPHQAFANLCCAHQGGWRRYVLTPADMDHIKHTAVQAARALSPDLSHTAGLKVVGVDLLLEAGPDGALACLALEANPRPAGLAQSWMLDAPGVPGVSLALFQGIRTACAGANVRAAG